MEELYYQECEARSRPIRQPMPEWIKMLVIGESGVGKTTFIKNLKNEHILGFSSLNMGRDSLIFAPSDDKIIHFDIIDIPGHPSFYHTWSEYMRNSQIILLMFDLTDIRTLFKIKTYWFDMIRKDIEPTSQAQFFLIGTKADLINQRQVLGREAEAFARHYAMKYYEIAGIHHESINQRLLGNVVKDYEKFRQKHGHEYSPTLRIVNNEQKVKEQKVKEHKKENGCLTWVSKWFVQP